MQNNHSEQGFPSQLLFFSLFEGFLSNKHTSQQDTQQRFDFFLCKYSQDIHFKIKKSEISIQFEAMLPTFLIFQHLFCSPDLMSTADTISFLKQRSCSLAPGASRSPLTTLNPQVHLRARARDFQGTGWEDAGKLKALQ